MSKHAFVTKDGRVVRSAYGVTPEVIKEIQANGQSEIWFESFWPWWDRQVTPSWRSVAYDLKLKDRQFSTAALDCHEAGATYVITLIERNGDIIAAPPGTAWNHREVPSA